MATIRHRAFRHRAFRHRAFRHRALTRMTTLCRTPGVQPMPSADAGTGVLGMRGVRRAHFVGIGGAGNVRCRRTANRSRLLGYRVRPSSGQGRPRGSRREVPASAMAMMPRRSTGADVVVVSSAVNVDNVEVTAAHRLRIPGGGARRDARRVDASTPGHRRRGHPWQDHHGQPDRERLPGGRPGSDLRYRGAVGRPRRPRPARDGNTLDCRSRRVRRVVPPPRTGRVGHHQHRPRPPRRLRSRLRASA